MNRKKKRRIRSLRLADRPAGSSEAAAPRLADVVMLFQQGRFRDAGELCQRILGSQSEFAEAWHLYGRIRFAAGEPDAAVEDLRKAVSLKPDYAAALNDLGNVLSELGRYEQAESAYREALDRTPDDRQLVGNLVDVLRRRCAEARRAGNFDEARLACERWLEIEPTSPIAGHIRAALSPKDGPRRASDEYVREVFDRFAESFDQQLEQLDYQGPRLLGRALIAQFGQPAGELDVLDAGCGTGLCGPVLRPYSRSLVGVDLSEQMLRMALAVGLYDDLSAAEITDFLGDRVTAFDLVAAIDTFNYFGDLHPPLRAAGRALRAGGVLVFTMERDQDDGDPGGGQTSYRLTPTGRFSHAETYVQDTLEETGFLVESVEAVVLRREADLDVQGLLIRAARSREPNRAD